MLIFSVVVDDNDSQLQVKQVAQSFCLTDRVSAFVEAGWSAGEHPLPDGFVQRCPAGKAGRAGGQAKNFEFASCGIRASYG
ncbi:hypothetical protein Veis_3072 [Verminephrobacter eiseniae EF01-2]|uniref:Uncharacterized protein n=1 Tax=Verminephrobacter eiseniae (strain EF01-2) TaxID=391735 RepID=A1WME8_VEREI|nr:hypothetical protein Veis_3072 [Verminephrobacter eiseniae EF01-2]